MSILEVSDIDRPYRGRRLSWREFYALRPDLKADNDNAPSLPNINASPKLTAKDACWWRLTEMRFEPELLRDILLYVEKHATRAHADIDEIDLPQWGDEAIAYHVKLATDDGLLDCDLGLLFDDEEQCTYIVYTIHGITPDGHRLIETIRDPAHWRMIKEGAAKVGNLGLTTLVQFAGAWVKHQITEKTGLVI